MTRPSLDDIFAEDDEFGLLDVRLRGSRTTVASDQGAGALREVSAFFEKHGRVPDPDAVDHDEMRLGSIWASIKSAPTDQMRLEDRFGLLDDETAQALKSWRDEPLVSDVPDSLGSGPIIRLEASVPA